MVEKIDKIAIIGLGLIGGSIAKTLRQKTPSIKIAAFDLPDVLNSALDEKVIDERIEDLSSINKNDIIFLCLPVEESLKMMREIAPILNNKNILTDVCGVKGIFAREWENLNSKGKFIGGHPMTGKEKGGFKNSDPLLFENSIYILCDGQDIENEQPAFINLIKSLGAKIIPLNAQVHDEIVANVSHLPQLLSVALMNSVCEENDDFKITDFAAGGFRDMTRIASSKFNIWESIIQLNKSEILEAIIKLESELKVIKASIHNSDNETLSRYFEKARFHRDEIPANTKGFLHPLLDLYVYVKDEPGIVAKISSALFEENINIKDMELLKIREGEGGVFRISFDSETDIFKAEEIMNRVGFNTK